MITHHAACPCCRTPVLPPGLDRRNFLRFAAVGAAGIALAPRLAHAQGTSRYQAMLLSCVDPRTQAPVADWMNQAEPQSHTASLKAQNANTGSMWPALGIAYGQDVLNDPKLELQAHMNDVIELKRELGIRHPEVSFQAWYVSRGSSGHFTEWKNLIAGPVIG